MSVPWYLMAKGKGGGGYKIASGPIVSISDALAAPLRSLRISIDPVQDLHGYDAPWPAGGGKNKFNVDAIGNSTYITVSNGVITVSGNSRNPSKKLSDLADLVVGETYVLTASTTGTANYIYLTSSAESWYFGQSRTISQNDLNSNVLFYAGGADVTANISAMMIRLSSVSDATYAPYSNICPISGWDEVNLWRTGKNLLDLTDYLINADSNYNKSPGTTLVFGSSGASVSGTNPIEIAVTTNWRGVTFFTEPLKTGTTYHLRYRITAPTKGNIKRSLYWVDEDNKVVEKVSFSSGVDLDVDHVYHAEITPPTDGLRMAFVVVSSTQQTITIYDMGVMVGEWETYAPYTGNQFTIQLGQTVYGGYISVSEDGSAELVVDRAEVDLGTLDWSAWGTVEGLYGANISDMKAPTTADERKTEIICSMYPVATTATMNNNFTDKSCARYQQNVFIRDTGYATADALTAALDGVQFIYPLATPITIPLSDITISTLAGQNVVWGDCGDVTVEYLASGGANADLMKLAVAFMGRK